MYSLFIDTHDKNVIVVLFKDGSVFKIKNISSNNKHSQVTLPTIRDILDEYPYVGLSCFDEFHKGYKIDPKKIPTLRILDYQRVTKKEREEAKKKFSQK